MLYRVWCAFIGLAPALSTAGYVPKGANCIDSIIPVTVTSNNRPWIAPKWNNNFEFIDFLSSASSRPSAGFSAPVGNPVKQTGSYKIGATFCSPQKPGNHSDTVIVATHGLGFDRRYDPIFCYVAATRVQRSLFALFQQLLEFSIPARKVQFCPVCNK